MIAQTAMANVKQAISQGEEVLAEAWSGHPCASEAAFASFHSQTARPLWRFVYYLCGDRSLTDDLVQEAYLKFLGSASRASPGPQLAGYLYRIAANLFTDHLRKSRVERRYLPSSHSDAEFRERLGDSQLVSVRQVESSVEAGELMSRLKNQDQVLIWMAYGEGLEHREIARRLSLQEKSVRVLLHRVRAKLAPLLKGRRV
jgi:RNA polymerase sigma-70 factor (ECF subfamily)